MSSSDGSTSYTNEKVAIHRDNEDKTQYDPPGTTDHRSAQALDINQLGPEGLDLQTAYDGKTILIPQPSSDPNDPLNWTPFKKHVALLVISVVAFLPEFGSSIGVVTLLPQAVCVTLREHFEKLADDMYIVSGGSLRTPFNITWLATCSAWERGLCLRCFCQLILADCQYSACSHLWP